MHRRIYGVFRAIFVPAAAIVAADRNENDAQDCVCRPSELPIYTPDPLPISSSRVTKEPCPPEPGHIEAGFALIRSSIVSVMTQAESIRKMGEDVVNDGVGKAEGLVGYLQEEDNVTTKAGAIGIGGLSGLIMGLRGGFFRRTLFGTIGALGMAAICYPKEAAECSEIGMVEGKKYLNIAYNFIYGGGDDDLLAITTDEEEVIGDFSIDPYGIVSDAHDLATNKDCHCPIGSCLGHHEEKSECLPSPDNPCPDEEPQEE